MEKQNKVTGVVLAGGLARRMQRADKGLELYRHQPLVVYALQALVEVADEVLINANRNIERYQAFGYPVITDLNDRFQGPLAGILAAMTVSTGNTLLVLPCDSPFIQARHLRKLLDSLNESGADAAVAFDGERLHPVFLALKIKLKGSLQQYLTAGERKVERWLRQHNIVRVDFSQEPEAFVNINTLTDLQRLH
ncbi:molybdenum cofactor guanylyltransferase MobA [Methylomarinum vadi]|uniref:molybdenum cofactor guanylyltransferase MobA n=1 Tax=Methylomarinum vadi TaxID=438855 RepID=UPI0004DF62A1|nr:molybdenum cofactor guanylyltransferase MobA [Methylomarinum vadi]